MHLSQVFIDICKLLCIYVKGVILNEDLMMMMTTFSSSILVCPPNIFDKSTPVQLAILQLNAIFTIKD